MVCPGTTSKFANHTYCLHINFEERWCYKKFVLVHNSCTDLPSCGTPIPATCPSHCYHDYEACHPTRVMLLAAAGWPILVDCHLYMGAV